MPKITTRALTSEEQTALNAQWSTYLDSVEKANSVLWNIQATREEVLQIGPDVETAWKIYAEYAQQRDIIPTLAGYRMKTTKKGL